MKRFFAALLAVLLLITLLPVSAFAVNVSSGSSLAAELAKANNTVTLTSDVTLSSQVIMGSGTTLDGQGHTITIASDFVNYGEYEGSHFAILATGSNTIKNCVFNCTVYGYPVRVANRASSVTVEGNTFKGKGRAFSCIDAGGTPSYVYLRNNVFESTIAYAYWFPIKIDNLYIEGNTFNGNWMSGSLAGIKSYSGNTFIACQGNENWIVFSNYPSNVPFTNTFKMADDFTSGRNADCFGLDLEDSVGNTYTADLSGCTILGNSKNPPRIAFENYGTNKNIKLPAGFVKTKVDGDITYFEGAAHTHSYEIRYEWNGSQCTATAVCTGCAEGADGHSVTETATGSFVQDSAATCTEPAKGHYTVSFQNPIFGTASSPVNGSSYGSALGHIDSNGDHRCDRCGIILEYVVKFMNDGFTYASVPVTPGQAVAFPREPYKQGHTFGGWSTTEDGKNVVASYTPSGDVVTHSLYAAWVKNAPDKPTEDAVKALGDAVIINDDPDGESTKGILGSAPEDFEIGEVTKNDDGSFSCVVTITNPDLYPEEGHEVDEFEKPTVELIFDPETGAWRIAEGGEAVLNTKLSTTEVTVTFIQPEHTNGKFPAVEAMKLTIPTGGYAEITLPDCVKDAGGEWVYVFRGWHVVGDETQGTWIDENTKVRVTGDITFIGVWRLASLTGDKTWNFRDAMAIMDHVDSSVDFKFCPEQLEIANFDLDKKNVINFRDSMAIMSFAEGTIPFPFFDDNPVD